MEGRAAPGSPLERQGMRGVVGCGNGGAGDGGTMMCLV